MSAQKEVKAVNIGAANKRMVGRDTCTTVPGRTSAAVAAMSAFESAQPSNTLEFKPSGRSFKRGSRQRSPQQRSRTNGAPKKKLPAFETRGTDTKCIGGTVQPFDAAAPAAYSFTRGVVPGAASSSIQGVVPGAVTHTTPDVVPASPDNKEDHKPNGASQERVMEKFDKPNLNVDKKEFQNDMKNHGFKGLAASRWA
ncbi:hypothetical protein F5Y00DRAFT_195612 [Daldinia vernicosa]|uniref:uncharacterized protein n=1 Tax=Daldinia vernicosa TaxID=114800 RepID=UPI002008C794|nr:uncharacterized protein F5Y00DRAFT_195612 [Daldinia vernicosa]KAI0852432.1 hypothetical protein F5Y00DRAFT_195612 [Daldinia vernicosa]